VQPTLWASFRDVDEVAKISDKDAQCLRDVRDVLAKHGALERFGLTLLHKHFHIADDEILLETTDVRDRTQIIRPVRKEDCVESQEFSLMTTALRFVDGEQVATAYCGCRRNKDGHTGQHQS
jgi:hypothetical protein